VPPGPDAGAAGAGIDDGAVGAGFIVRLAVWTPALADAVEVLVTAVALALSTGASADEILGGGPFGALGGGGGGCPFAGTVPGAGGPGGMPPGGLPEGGGLLGEALPLSDDGTRSQSSDGDALSLEGGAAAVVLKLGAPGFSAAGTLSSSRCANTIPDDSGAGALTCNGAIHVSVRGASSALMPDASDARGAQTSTIATAIAIREHVEIRELTVIRVLLTAHIGQAILASRSIVWR
jgi:hypothetical protein